MARYKHIDASPRFLPIDLTKQLRPGTFEYALNHLLDSEIDLSSFDVRFHNDDAGACAYPPALLLKIVLFAYSQGIVSSRSIERACCEQVTFIRRPPHCLGPLSRCGRPFQCPHASPACVSPSASGSCVVQR
jgi:hypothetical protein